MYGIFKRYCVAWKKADACTVLGKHAPCHADSEKRLICDFIDSALFRLIREKGTADKTLCFDFDGKFPGGVAFVKETFY